MKKYQTPQSTYGNPQSTYGNPQSTYGNPAPKQTLPANYDYEYPKENPSYLSSSNVFTNHEEPKKAALPTYNHEYQPYVNPEPYVKAESYVKPEPESVPIKQNDTYRPYYSTYHPPQYQSNSYQPENANPHDNYTQYYSIQAPINVSESPINYQEQPKYVVESARSTHKEPVDEKISDFPFESRPAKKDASVSKKNSENPNMKNKQISPDFNAKLEENFKNSSSGKNLTLRFKKSFNISVITSTPLSNHPKYFSLFYL